MGESSQTPRPPHASPHWTDDLALDLQHGLLSRSEEEAALQHAAACAACAERLRAVARDYHGGLARRERLQVRRAAWWQRFRARRTWAVALPVAAAVTLVVWGPWRAAAPQPAWLPAYDASLRLRLPADPQRAEQLEHALQAYGKHDTRAAAEALATLRLTGSLELVRQVYLANALLFEGRDDEALPLLEALVQQPLPDPWSEEVRWGLFVALERGGEEARARALLAELAASDSEVGARARAWRARKE